MTADPVSIAEALTEAAKAINEPRTLEETLDSIVRATVETVPGFDHVGISILHGDGRIETKAGTDQLVWELDDLQYTLGEGPCVAALHTDHLIVVERAQHDQRWPRYIPAAARVGLRAQMAMRLYSDDKTLGGLNMYATESETIAPEAAPIAEMFAAHASIALGHAWDLHHLNTALTSRQLIGQATGLIMQRYQIDQVRAFNYLLRASSTAQVKVRVIAEEIVTAADRAFSVRSPDLDPSNRGDGERDMAGSPDTSSRRISPNHTRSQP
jgi:transcriptional regulator with GAF, ATPase, and Fis domain